MMCYAWVLEVRPGYEELYKQRHDAIWPEMLAELRAAGVHNYNIFRYGLTLFGYFETDNLAETKSRLSKSVINAKWSEFMEPIMKIDLDPTTNFPYLLPLQFHMD
jgi:L-rhamnose mutarotase